MITSYSTSNLFLLWYHQLCLINNRLTITASCPMDLQYFPMDRQLCGIEIESCKYFSSLTDVSLRASCHCYTWLMSRKAIFHDKFIFIYVKKIYFSWLIYIYLWQEKLFFMINLYLFMSRKAICHDKFTFIYVKKKMINLYLLDVE